MNYLGKALVLLNLLLSVLFLAWAGAVYLQRVDWGWKDPRKDLNPDFVVPSEIDKRTALLKQLLPIRDRVNRVLDDEKGRVGLVTGLAGLERTVAENHEWYNAELARLESAPGKIEIQEVKRDKGQVVTDRMGRPVLEKKVTFTDADKKTTDVDQSYASYRGDLKAVLEKVGTTTTGIQKWVAQEKDLTVKLNGKEDEKGRVLVPGLYPLTDRENAAQEALKREINYLRPLWVQQLVDAQLLLERREGLRARLEELKAVQAARR